MNAEDFKSLVSILADTAMIKEGIMFKRRFLLERFMKIVDADFFVNLSNMTPAMQELFFKAVTDS